MKKLLIPFSFLMALSVMVFSCKQGSDAGKNYLTSLVFNPGDEAKIEEALLTLKDSTSVLLKEGLYHFDNLSIASVNHILLKGEGHDKTILDFSSQSSGG